MNDDLDNMQLDAAIEALARPEPPRDHVAQVLARTGSATVTAVAGTTARSAGEAVSASRPSLLAWSLGAAAASLAAVGATWQLTRLPAVLPELSTAHSDFRPSPSSGPQVDLPVLPPQAYWAMDPFVEFEALRPGWRHSGRRHAIVGAGRDGSNGASLTARDGPADDELAWVPMPSGLAPIEIASIMPAPLAMAPITPLEDIALAEIALAPIVFTPLADQEERP